MPDDKSDPFEANEGQAKSASPQAPGEATEPESDLEGLLAENANMRDKLLRTMADMENLRRRTEREKEDTARYAISNFARDVLAIGDNLRRVIEHVSAEEAAQDPALKSFLEGVELTERELLKMLEKHGVAKLEALGGRFDPNQQQAMYEVQAADVPDGTVVEVMQAGYTIGDRVLRPALVAVSKGGPKAAVREEKDGPKQGAKEDKGNGSGPEPLPDGDVPDGGD